ncbi:hypothetical protein [Yoonia sp. 2307UL14-13]|uniref:hypothetical protein n=1 Tax=Yoonia sp. 2307UL14-13 TaxID=3126506 RepID=UPI0030999CCB
MIARRAIIYGGLALILQQSVMRGLQAEEKQMTPMERKLEAVRAAALVYLDATRPEKWDVHIAELRSAPFTEIDGNYRLGNWIWDNVNDILIRDAELLPVTVRYGMRFDRVDAHEYEVSSDFWEREIFDFEE